MSSGDQVLAVVDVYGESSAFGAVYLDPEDAMYDVGGDHRFA
jgi:hypothetical protein